MKYRYGFNGKEKDDEVFGAGDSYDFGARIYNPRLGRMMSIDKYNWIYPCLSPYNGMGDDPISSIDVGGNLIIFVSGYWYGHNHDDDSYLQLEDYWDVDVKANAAKTFSDYQALYYNGSSGISDFLGENHSFAAQKRKKAGASMAYNDALYIKELLDKERETNPNAKLNFVSHSMGGAYAVGMINALADVVYPPESPHAGENVFKPEDFGESDFLAPFESKNLVAPEATINKQFSHIDDGVAGYDRMKNISKNSGEYSATINNVNGGLLNSLFAHFNGTFSSIFAKKGDKNKLPKNVGGVEGGNKNKPVGRRTNTKF